MCCSSKDAFKGVCGGGLIQTAGSKARRWAERSMQPHPPPRNGVMHGALRAQKIRKMVEKGTATAVRTAITRSNLANTWITKHARRTSASDSTEGLLKKMRSEEISDELLRRPKLLEDHFANSKARPLEESHT